MSDRRASMDGPHDDGCPCPYCSQERAAEGRAPSGKSDLTDPRPGPLPPLAAAPPAAAPGLPGRAGTSPRDELVAAVEDAILRVDGRVSDRAIAAAIDATSPLIRAGLRVQVEALRRQHGPGRAHDGLYTYPCSRCDALEEVLALFDGGSDE